MVVVALALRLVVALVLGLGLAAVVRVLEPQVGLLLGLAESLPLRLVPERQVEALARLPLERLRHLLVGPLVRPRLPLVPGVPPRPLCRRPRLVFVRLLPERQVRQLVVALVLLELPPRSAV